MRQDDRIVLTTYGRLIGFCVDPIEKKPLSHYYPGSGVLSFGTAGCNLKCKFCQNWDMSNSQQVERRSERATPETIANAAVELGCKSVAFTYNDPVVFLEYAVDTARVCHRRGIQTVAVTAGEINPEPRAEFFRWVNAANIDLKAFTESFYRKLCGGDLKAVLDTLVYLREKTEVWIELTTLLIPGENDSDRELQEMTRWVVENLGAEVPMHFTAFHPDWKMLEHPPTPATTLTRAREIARAAGVHYAYTGNVHDRQGATTLCSQCGTALIERDWHQLTLWNLTPRGNCPDCGTPCHGRFDPTPGPWSGRCLPVHPSDYA
jgi:pyruvate formate lyase activating enzyme